MTFFFFFCKLKEISSCSQVFWSPSKQAQKEIPLWFQSSFKHNQQTSAGSFTAVKGCGTKRVVFLCSPSLCEIFVCQLVQQPKPFKCVLWNTMGKKWKRFIVQRGPAWWKQTFTENGKAHMNRRGRSVALAVSYSMSLFESFRISGVLW